MVFKSTGCNFNGPVEAAKRAGARCIAITNTNSAEKLQAADIVVSSLEEIDPKLWLQG